MNKIYLAVSAALIVSPIAAHAQEAQDNRVQVLDAQPQSAQAAPAPVLKTVVLPANSEILLRMSEELSTKGGQVKEGQMFRMTVSHDVKVNGVTVIPAGTPAAGEVTWKTGRAVFGKSGKMQVALRHIDLNGERVEVSGEYRQEGEGDTLAAVGAVLLAPALGIITGKSAVIPRGKEMMAHTVSPLTVTVAS